MGYASLSDVENVGLPPAAISSLTPAQQAECLQSASDFADNFFRARWGTHAVPFTAWDSAVTEAVAKIAAFRMIKVRGFRSTSAADQELRRDYDDAVKWLNAVQRQQAHPLVTPATLGAPGSVQPLLTSSSVVDLSNGARAANRGW